MLKTLTHPLYNLPQNWDCGFVTPASPVMEGIVSFHHDLFFFLVMILTFVMYILGRCIVLFNKDVNPQPIVVTHAPVLEVVWTVIPAFILILIAVPSFSLLFSLEEFVNPLLTIKVIGHQWYWSYEFVDPSFLLKSIFTLQVSKEQGPLNPVVGGEPSLWKDLTPEEEENFSFIVALDNLFNNNYTTAQLREIFAPFPLSWDDQQHLYELGLIEKQRVADKAALDAKRSDRNATALKKAKEFLPNLNNNVIFSYDSYMLTSDNVSHAELRLLEVDNKLYLPARTNIRFVVTSADVLHSWAIPALGIKVDACPGRLNQVCNFINRPGTFYGQCSEICGVNHGFMPINVVAIDILVGADIWYSKQTESTIALFNYLVQKKIDA